MLADRQLAKRSAMKEPTAHRRQEEPMPTEAVITM